MPDPVTTPNNTIYINNLNEKIKKDELKILLNAVFSQFGKILDIVVVQTLKMRGQAFVVFDDIKSATAAFSSMQSYPFYGKPMRIQYAKTDSDGIAKRKGTYVERIKEPRPEPGERKKNQADANDKKKKKSPKDAQQLPQQPGLLPGIPAGAMVQSLVPNVFSTHPGIPAGAMVQSLVPNVFSTHPGIPPTMPQAQTMDQPPNKILFVTNLPKEATDELVSVLFYQYPGFKEVRLAPGRHGIAFVEFENETFASTAKDFLEGFEFTESNPIHITYANK